MEQSGPREKDLHGSGWDDQRAERVIGIILQSGVILSGVVVLLGGILYLVRYGHVPLGYQNFVAQREKLPRLGMVLHSAASGDGQAVIECGLLLLIATPVARVAFSVVAFALEKDRLYVVVTLVVFFILLYSLFGGAS